LPNPPSWIESKLLGARAPCKKWGAVGHRNDHGQWSCTIKTAYELGRARTSSRRPELRPIEHVQAGAIAWCDPEAMAVGRHGDRGGRGSMPLEHPFDLGIEAREVVDGLGGGAEAA